MAGSTGLPPRLAVALHRVHADELIAVADQRRQAFRLTRALLGGARRAGYPAALLAECLGVSVSSIRARSGSDGWLTAEAMTDLADLPPGTVERWTAADLLHPVSAVGGQLRYSARDFVRALAFEQLQVEDDVALRAGAADQPLRRRG